jgi:predicted RNase H-like nuclease
MIVIGLDGFKAGWVAVTIDGPDRRICFPSHIDWLANQPFDRAAIDIPIGMNDDGERDCDRLAREMLRPHGCRVFGGARRWLWEFSDPDEANARATMRKQKRISRQLWHLGKKIMEIDGFLRNSCPRPDLRETHPELVFLRLKGSPLPSKKTPEGEDCRMALLLADGFSEIVDWLDHARIGSGAKKDDVLDACAAAIAARDLSGCLPGGESPPDNCGLPLQIWF